MSCQPDQLQAALDALSRGELIAYPTEAVWGIGCDPFNKAALMKLLALKSRPIEKGVILAAANQQQIEPLLRGLSAEQQALLDQTWPGPNTWLLPDPDEWTPSWIRGEHSSVAVRVSAHPLVHKLCSAFGGPIVSTSANPAGLDPAMTASEVRAYFGDRLYVLEGDLGGATAPSQIRDLQTGQIIRGA